MTDLVRREAEFRLHQDADDRTRIEVRFDGDTAWLSLGLIAELFHRDNSVFSRHIKTFFERIHPAHPEEMAATSGCIGR